MTTPALLALTEPSKAPDAAMARLLVTADALLYESESPRAGPYAGLLAMLSAAAERVSSLLAVAIAGSATGQEIAGIANTERLARAGAVLCDELAVRSTRREQVTAMGWATLCRRVLADTALTAREHAAGAYLGVAWPSALEHAPIRILPGADATLVELGRDPLLVGADWELDTLAATLARWVTIA